MKRSAPSRLWAALFLCLLVSGQLLGQNEKHPDSPVFKKPPEPPSIPTVPQSDVTRQIWDTFMLERQANAGDLSAQNDLGVRYLLGKGIGADTAKAVRWISRAAQGGLLLGQFNYGLLYYQGIGVAWNPFLAFKYFHAAAERGFADAQYLLFQFFVENLVVPRNLDSARVWLSKAAAQGHQAAAEALKRVAAMEKPTARPGDSGAVAGKAVAISAGLLEDSSGTVHHRQTMVGMLRTVPAFLQKTLGIDSLLATDNAPDSLFVRDLMHAASVGSPEALLILGRLHERGVTFTQDSILAAEYYLRAVRLDSQRGGELLARLLQIPTLIRTVKTRALRGDVDAKFVWAELALLGFGGSLYDQKALLTPEQAVQMLAEGEKAGHVPSMIVLGLCSYSGEGCPPDQERALALWERAAANGNGEAAVRVALVRLRGTVVADSAARFVHFLQEAADEGSLPAQVGLAYCTERGIGIPANTGEAVRLYHEAWVRGSRDAYRALERICDALRPPEKAFSIERNRLEELN